MEKMGVYPLEMYGFFLCVDDILHRYHCTFTPTQTPRTEIAFLDRFGQSPLRTKKIGIFLFKKRIL